MELKLVTNTSRNAVIELTESGKYYTEKQYEIFVNDEKFMDSDKVITSLYGLTPDTEYKVFVDGTNIGKMKSNLAGKISISIEVEPEKQYKIQVVKL